MKNKPWRIHCWGDAKIPYPEGTTCLTLDNREQASSRQKTTPLLTMQVSDRYTIQELNAYLVQIRDALNAAGIVEGTIEDPDAPKSE